MNEVIKLVKTYRLTAGIAERLRLAEEIFRHVEPDLRFFVFSAIRPPAAEDEVGKGRNVLMARIATGDWDGVIVSHSSFSRLPVRRETQPERDVFGR